MRAFSRDCLSWATYGSQRLSTPWTEWPNSINSRAMLDLMNPAHPVTTTFNRTYPPGGHYGLGLTERCRPDIVQHSGHDFCIETLQEALTQGRPQVFNTDQGSQFTSGEFIQTLQEHRVKISMDGKGRYQGNIFVERS